MAQRLSDLCNFEKPRERLQKYGVENLSNVELLSLIIGSGTKKFSVLEVSRNILKKSGGLKYLFQSSFQQLIEEEGVGTAKASLICGIGEIFKRMNNEDTTGIKIKNPVTVAQKVREKIKDASKEHLYCLSLDARNNLIEIDLISMGTANETLIHPREVFKKAISRSAISIVLAHNHPSGELDPSKDDLQSTEQIATAGKEMGIPLLDHVIVSDTKHLSLKSEGYFEKVQN